MDLSLIIAIVAVLIAFGGLIEARRSRKASQDSAGAASRSATAAERSATAAESQVTFAERQDQREEQTLQLRHAAHLVGGSVMKRQGEILVHVSNSGEGAARGVVVQLVIPGDPKGEVFASVSLEPPLQPDRHWQAPLRRPSWTDPPRSVDILATYRDLAHGEELQSQKIGEVQLP